MEQVDPHVQKTFRLRRSLLGVIEDFRFSRRIKTEAEAFRRLVMRGLAAEDASTTAGNATGQQPQN